MCVSKGLEEEELISGYNHDKLDRKKRLQGQKKNRCKIEKYNPEFKSRHFPKKNGNDSINVFFSRPGEDLDHKMRISAFCMFPSPSSPAPPPLPGCSLLAVAIRVVLLSLQGLVNPKTARILLQGLQLYPGPGIYKRKNNAGYF